MQTIANYLLEFENPSQDRVSHLHASSLEAINDWLAQKGAPDVTADTGTFASLSPYGVGTYTRTIIRAHDDTLTQITLDEPANADQTFTTTVSIAAMPDRLAIYVHQSVRNTRNIIAPVFTDPKCPWVIRALFKLTDEWTLGGRSLPLPIARQLHGDGGGSSLAAMIEAPERRIPVVVVSENEGRPVWASIADDLAADLTALAEVVAVDESASWALTNRIGKMLSCYRGAIRVYWPRRGSGEALGHSPVWTASTLLSTDHYGVGEVRFRATLRRMIMTTAALTIEPPAAIDEIIGSAARQQLAELEAKTTSQSEELEIAKLFLADNEHLRKELAEAKKELASWSGRTLAAEYALSERADGDVRESETIDDEEPQPGEVRFYKKTRNTPNYDVLVQVASCGHTKWQPAHKAEKARKGLERALGGETWKRLQHCGVCTGGGTWRVEW